MKEKYQVPQIEIIQVENEGLMAASATIGDFTGNNNMFPSSRAARRTSSNASTPNLQELEDLINDILTVSK